MRRKRAKEKSLLFVSRARFAFVTLALTCVFAAIGVRLYYLHVVKNDWSVAITDKVRCRIDKINARRGDITDIRGNLLATSRPIIELGVDPEMIKEVLDVMLDLAKEGMTMLLVTHEMGFAKAAADKVIFMDNGEVIESSSPDEMFTDPKNERTKDFLNHIL